MLSFMLKEGGLEGLRECLRGAGGHQGRRGLWPALCLRPTRAKPKASAHTCAPHLWYEL